MYKEALERCKKEFNFNNLAYSHEEIKQRLERVFPELKKSIEYEYEKIINGIIDFVTDPTLLLSNKKQEYITFLEEMKEKGKRIHFSRKVNSEKQVVLITESNGKSNIDWDTRSLEDAKALLECGLQYINTELEKQGEKNPVDKFGTKFKVGDWIVNKKGGIGKISEIKYDNYGTLRYYIEWSNGNLTDPMPCFVDGSCHLWTFQDAKDGDVLASDNGAIILVKESRGSSWGYRLSYHCAVLYDGSFEPREFHVEPEKFFPSTKEQRDILFQKMKEEGYEWDAEKKELKKIEQDSSAYFYCKYGGTIPKCSDCERNHFNSKYKTEEIKTWMIPGTHGTKQCLSYIQQNPTDKVEPKFKVKYADIEYNVLEVKDIAGITYYGIEDEPNHIDYVLPENCKIVNGGYNVKEKGSPYPTKSAIFSEQNLAWSEEDERLLSKLQTYVDMESFDRECNCEDLIDWLKKKSEQKYLDKTEIAEQFARIIRGHLTQIDKEVQLEFENLYTEITGKKMYEGYND